MAAEDEGVGAPTPLQKFYLTFGVQYRHTPHPRWAGADPDGFVEIRAADEPAARELAVAHFGQYWSMLSPEQYFNVAENTAKYYPKGIIMTVTPTGSETP